MMEQEVIQDKVIVDDNGSHYPTVKQSVKLMLLLLLLSAVTSVPYIVFTLIPDVFQGPIYLSIGLFISYGASFWWVIYIAKRKIAKEGKWTLKWSFKKSPIAVYVYVVLLTLACVVVIDPIVSLIPMPEFFEKMFESMQRTDVFSFLTIVILAPIFEEMLFRGVLLQGFLKNYSAKKSIIWSALIFGLVHLNPWQGIAGILIGILIGWLYVKTKSLLPGMIIHFTNNLVAFVLVAVSGGKQESWMKTLNEPFVSGLMMVVGVVSIVLLIKLLHRQFQAHGSHDESSNLIS
jgi:membrane protease YdiL (CAAX protease family)